MRMKNEGKRFILSDSRVSQSVGKYEPNVTTSEAVQYLQTGYEHKSEKLNPITIELKGRDNHMNDPDLDH